MTSTKPKPYRPSRERPAKVALSIRLDPELVAWYKRAGPGYQQRMREALIAHAVQGGK